MAAHRATKGWAENYHYLRQSQQQLDDFITTLTQGDWKLRGPYPWGDYGSLAELLMVNANHYAEHIPDLKTWYERTHQ